MLAIRFPVEVMKMRVSMKTTVTNGKSLLDVKKEVYEEMWKKIGEVFPSVPQHGKEQDIRLWQEGIEVVSDEQLGRIRGVLDVTITQGWKPQNSWDQGR